MNTYKNINTAQVFCLTWTKANDLNMGTIDPGLVITTGEDNLEPFATQELAAARWLELSGVAWVEPDKPDEPADIPPASKIICSPRQIRQALTLAGLRDSVEAAVLEGDQDMKDWWAYATSFEEDHPVVIAMATALGVSDVDLHELFEVAVNL